MGAASSHPAALDDDAALELWGSNIRGTPRPPPPPPTTTTPHHTTPYAQRIIEPSHTAPCCDAALPPLDLQDAADVIIAELDATAKDISPCQSIHRPMRFCCPARRTPLT